MRRLYPKACGRIAATFSPFFFPALPCARHAARRLRVLNGRQQRSRAMTKQPPVVVEIAAQIVLAAAIGLFVSIVLAGMAMLLAA
jgi:hypothetical protein